MESVRKIKVVRSALFAATCLLWSSAWSCVAPWLQSQSFDVIGVASNSDGQTLYRERLIHAPGSDGGQLSVTYTNPKGALIANKAVQYQCRPTTPSFSLTGPMGESLENVRWTEQQVVAGTDNDASTLDLPTRPAIVDAGFDNAIKINWDDLIAGEKPVFAYLFPRRGKFLNLRFARVDSAPANTPPDDESLVHFRITPANAFIRLFASPLYVGYRADSRELRYYLGPSNLPSMDDENEVLIVYESAGSTTSKE